MSWKAERGKQSVGDFEQQRTGDRMIVGITGESFLPGTLETLRARKDAAYLLLPEAEEKEDSVLLYFNIGGMESLNEAFVHLENEALLNAVRQLVDAVLNLPKCGLDITQVLTATDQVMLENNGIRLLCLCSKPAAADRIAARKALIQQIRQMIAGREGMDDLAGFLANPYCSLEAIRGRLQKKQETVPEPVKETTPAEPEVPSENQGACPVPCNVNEEKKDGEPEPAKPVAASTIPLVDEPEEANPGEITPSVSRPFQPVFFTPMNAVPTTAEVSSSVAGVKQEMNTKQLFVPMGGIPDKYRQGKPFVSMESVPRNRPAASIPARETEPLHKPAATPGQTLHGDIDEETVFDSVPLRMTSVMAGMDEPTVADEANAVRAVSAGSMDDETVVDSVLLPKPADKGKGNRRKAMAEKTVETKQDDSPENKPEKTQPVPRQKLSMDPKKAFWESVSRIAVYAVAAAVLAILTGAFLGGTGIILIILAAAVGLALLFRQGYLTLKWPKKPDAAAEQPAAPNVEKIFTVRLRMISQNLATHQEVIIRENNQIIGSDPSVCRSPVSYRGISRKHCRISCKRAGGHEEYFITDLGSTNGTQLNGEKLKPNMPYSLKLGDHVTLAGKYDFKISSDAY